MARSDLIRHHLPYIVCFAPDDYTDWRQSGGGNYIKQEAIRSISISIFCQVLMLVTGGFSLSDNKEFVKDGPTFLI